MKDRFYEDELYNESGGEMNLKRIYVCTSCVSIIVLIVIVFNCFTEISFAQTLRYDAAKGEYKRKDSERVTIVGKIVNIAYELQHRTQGAYAQDSLFSKGRHGLMTSGGTIWTFVDNVKGQDLQWNKKYLDTFIAINGWVFHDAQYIEVDSFTLGGQEYQWSNKTNAFEPIAVNKEKS